MSTQFNFNGQNIKIPGVYSNIKSGIRNPSVALPYGNLLIVDTGSGAGYGGGAGIDGELASGKDAIYEFDNIEDFRNFSKGGYWWLLAQPLFRPAGLGVNGVSKIYFAKAATTTAASMTYTFYGDGGASLSQSIGNVVNGGVLNIKVTDEGLIGNGTLNGSVLTKGFAAKMSAGKINTSKFVLTFYRGAYTGLDQNGLPYDGISELDSTPVVLAKSPEFDNIQTLIDWMAIDANFLKYFKLTSSLVNGTGVVDADDLADNTAYKLAAGGTESYAASTLIDSTLTAVEDLLVNFILSDKSGSDAQSTINTKLVEFSTVDSKWNPEVYIAGGDDVNTFETYTIAAAEAFDNDSVSIVHGAIYKQSQQGLRTYNALYHAAAYVGREAGLAPQVPLTFKNLDFDGIVHKLNDREVTQALDAGVLTTRLENGSFDIVKGINSLQQNTFLVNDNGTTHSKQIKRIARQLNNGIRVNAKAELLKQPNGVNRNTLTINDVESWTAKYLKAQIALPDNDNLILSFQDIVVTRNADAYNISYKFVPNSEISFLFFTGLLIGI